MLARLMVGAASLAAARLSVVMARSRKALSEYIKTAFPLPAYLKRHRIRPFPAVHTNAKGPDHDPIYTTARAERGRSLHRPGRYRPERRFFRRAGQCGAQARPVSGDGRPRRLYVGGACRSNRHSRAL